MSKTRNTRPFWVKLLDHPTYLEPLHSCTIKGVECDLPEVSKYKDQNGDTCYWVPSPASYYVWELRCRCHICTKYNKRRIERRRDRHQARKYARGGWMDEYLD